MQAAAEVRRAVGGEHHDEPGQRLACGLEFRRIFTPATPTWPGKPAPPRPSLADTLVYLDRWLPGTLRRIKTITEKCTGIDGHISPPR